MIKYEKKYVRGLMLLVLRTYFYGGSTFLLNDFFISGDFLDFLRIKLCEGSHNFFSYEYLNVLTPKPF